jgi:hypothetical protein
VPSIWRPASPHFPSHYLYTPPLWARRPRRSITNARGQTIVIADAIPHAGVLGVRGRMCACARL